MITVVYLSVINEKHYYRVLITIKRIKRYKARKFQEAMNAHRNIYLT